MENSEKNTTFMGKYNINDYDRVIEFFRNLYLENYNLVYWLPQRFEYTQYFVSLLEIYRGNKFDWKDSIYLWKDAQKNIVGILNSESPDENIFIHTLQDYRFLEDEMIDLAETEIICELQNKSRILIWCNENDKLRASILKSKGYAKQTEVEYLNWVDLNIEIKELPLPTSYSIHNMTNEAGLDLPKKIQQMTKAFDSETYPIEFYRSIQSGPSYRKDLDIYTTDIDGNTSSFCIIWIDEKLKIGYIEPVGVDSQHRRKGLGRITLNRALLKLKNCDVIRAYVGSYGNDRMNFYNSSGFTNRMEFHTWEKML